MKLKLELCISIGLVGGAAVCFALKQYYNCFAKEKQIKKLTKENKAQTKIIEDQTKEIVRLEGKLREQEENHKRKSEQNQKDIQKFIKELIKGIKNSIVGNLKHELQSRIDEQVNQTLNDFCQENWQEKKIIDQIQII